MLSTLKDTILVLLVCSVNYLHAQNLAGKWVGQLYQNEIDWYDFELDLTSNGDSSTYVGTSYIKNQQGSGTMLLTASFKNSILHFQESKIKKENWSSIGWHWCIKSGDLQLTERKDSLVLSGNWQAPGTCRPGTIRVAKANKIQTEISAKPVLPMRKVETKDQLQVTEEEIIIEIWDHETEDGDIASVILNGVEVIKKHLVTVEKYQFRIALKPGKNMLVLFAENLGTRPPNTAAITIHYDGKTKTVVLNSDKTKSEAIEINH